MDIRASFGKLLTTSAKSLEDVFVDILNRFFISFFAFSAIPMWRLPT